MLRSWGAAFSTRAMIKHRWVASEDLGEENAAVIEGAECGVVVVVKKQI